MSTPIIGITLSGSFSESDFSQLESNPYFKAIRSTGGTPRLIPNQTPIKDLPALLESFSGVLISGGADIGPDLYHAKILTKPVNFNPQRDSVEFEVAKLAMRSDKPILGICRGHQMLNVALGGTLFQDIPTEYPSQTQHQAGRIDDAHQVEILAGTRLWEIVRKNPIRVNSRHHQAIHEIAPQLRVTATASDGLIEGIELPGHRFFLGIQWHPEDLYERNPEHGLLFQEFIAAACD